jgi:hypothetical protein
MISRDRAVAMLSRFVGLRVARPWRGYGAALFLELGRLHTVIRKSKKGIRRSRDGQVTFMIDPQWRVEKPRSIQFASNSKEGRFAKGMVTLEGQVLTGIALTEGLPELQVTFGDGRRLSTFCDWLTQPAWTILINDRSLVDIGPVWEGVDVTACLHVRAGRLAVEYDFDERDIDIRRLRKFHFYRRGKKRK